MLAAYNAVKAFAYPGWRLTVPGGPAGGHYKGFTHTQAAGTDIAPGDNYENDRADGMSSHDTAHITLRNPRGVYRSSGEVPPRPNASGSAHTYRGLQTRHQPGQSVAPGSFPADYSETAEDAFLHFLALSGLEAVPESEMIRMQPYPGRVCPAWGCGGPEPIGPIIANTGTISVPAAPATGATSVVNQPPATPLPTPPAQAVAVPSAGTPIPPGASTSQVYQDSAGNYWAYSPGQASWVNFGSSGAAGQQAAAVAAANGASSSASLATASTTPVSPTPAPIVATNQVVPLNDGSGNYVNLSTGAIVPASTVSQNPYTMQLVTSQTAAAELIPANDGSGNYINPQTGAVIPASAIGATAANTLAVPAAASSTVSSAISWLEQSTIFPPIPDVVIYGGGLLLALALIKKVKL